MKSKKLFGLITLLAIALLIITSVIPAKSNTATLWTNKADYSPGETVTIYGTGFDPSGNLVVTVERPDGHIDSSEDTGTDVVHKVTIVNWAEGDLTATYQLDGIEGTYIVTARDETNTATITFTDAENQDFWGWKLDSRTPAFPSWPGDWVKGDLGKEWLESDWVSYVLVLNGYGGIVLPDFKVYWDFYISGKDGVFVDLVRNFRYEIRDPYPGSGKPDDVTPALANGIGGTWGTTFTPNVINEPFPDGTTDDQYNPPTFAYWELTPNTVFSSPIPTGKSVAIYFEARLAPSFVWTNGLEYLLDATPTDAWGGDRYTGWTATHGGAGYTSGSNPQFRLDGEGVGEKTVPIPIPPVELGEISGTKYNDLNANGQRDEGEPGLEGWIIHCDTIIDEIPLPSQTTTDADGNFVFTDLTPATYTLYEEQQVGWTQTDPTPIPPGEYTVPLGPDEIATAKDFGNYMPGKIIVEKQTDPDGSTVDFEFDPSWSATNFFLADGEQEDSGWLVPGDYSVDELDKTGWDLISVTKNGGAFTDDTTFALGAGETVTLVYTNRQRGKIIIDKVTDPAADPQSFDFSLTGGPDSINQAFSLTDTDAPHDSGWIKPGTYTATEITVPQGWELLSATCDDGSPVDTISLQPGETIIVTFTNKKLLEFLKQFTDSGALGDYTIPDIIDPKTSQAFEIKTGPQIWWEVTYAITNEDSEGHYYSLWDKWGGNLMVLASEPDNYVPNSGRKTGGFVTLSDGSSFDIRYDGYAGYIGAGLALTDSMGNTAYATLHTGDLQEGTNPGKGKGNNKDGSSYDVDISWYVYVPAGETVYLTIYVAPGINPGGVLQFSSWGTNVINTGPRVRVWADDTYDDFLYSWTFTNQLTVIIEEP